MVEADIVSPWGGAVWLKLEGCHIIFRGLVRGRIVGG